jgi:hypothetical protein
MVVMQLHMLVAFSHHHSSDRLVEHRQPCQHLRLILESVQASTVAVSAVQHSTNNHCLCVQAGRMLSPIVITSAFSTNQLVCGSLDLAAPEMRHPTPGLVQI